MASTRKEKARAERRARKEARMAGKKPKSKSKYALKLRGIFPPNSPYRSRWSGLEPVRNINPCNYHPMSGTKRRAA